MLQAGGVRALTSGLFALPALSPLTSSGSERFRCPSLVLGDFNYLFGFPKEIGSFDLVVGGSFVPQRVGQGFWVTWGPGIWHVGKGFHP